MEAKFTMEEDYKFLHKIARETGSGEQAWRKAGVDHRDYRQHHLVEKRKKTQEKAQENDFEGIVDTSDSSDNDAE